MRIVNDQFTEIAKIVGVKHVVRISSYGIDNYLNGKGVTQGPLGEAHVHGERSLLDAGITLTSVRPTSFSSNFARYDLPRVRERDSFASPLGDAAAVNWVACEDVAAVAARALLDATLDGRMLDVTGPPSSTLTARQFQVPVSAPSVHHSERRRSLPGDYAHHPEILRFPAHHPPSTRRTAPGTRRRARAGLRALAQRTIHAIIRSP